MLLFRASFFRTLQLLQISNRCPSRSTRQHHDVGCSFLFNAILACRMRFFPDSFSSGRYFIFSFFLGPKQSLFQYSLSLRISLSLGTVWGSWLESCRQLVSPALRVGILVFFPSSILLLSRVSGLLVGVRLSGSFVVDSQSSSQSPTPDAGV